MELVTLKMQLDFDGAQRGQRRHLDDLREAVDDARGVGTIVDARLWNRIQTSRVQNALALLCTLRARRCRVPAAAVN